MSIKVMTYVWDGFPASGSELLAMLALADWCDDNGGSLFPSIKSIAEKIRVSDSQARRIVRGFETSGFVTVVGNAYGGAPGTTRQYRLNVAKLRQLADEKNAETGCINATPSANATPRTDTQDGSHGCARGLAPMPAKPSLTTKEPSSTNTDVIPKDDVVFAALWSAYPARPGKSKADTLKAFRARLKEGDDANSMLDGVLAYARYCQDTNTEPQFIKQPSTFLGPGKFFQSDWTAPAMPRPLNGKQAKIDAYHDEMAAIRQNLYGTPNPDGGIRHVERDITGECNVVR